jgi:hypothetical protein
MPQRKKREIPAETFHFWTGEGFALKIKQNFGPKAPFGGKTGAPEALTVNPPGPYCFRTLKQGGLAQLGERYNGIVEVIGSSPLSSTIGDKNPFGDHVERISDCGAKHCVIESADRPDVFRDRLFPPYSGVSHLWLMAWEISNSMRAGSAFSSVERFNSSS